MRKGITKFLEEESLPPLLFLLRVQEAGTNLLLPSSNACYLASLDPFVPLLVPLMNSEVKKITG
uniref:Uncharacterized protein n=1 Tax=Arundo donax TaxID=35708 RepID=A0A0A9GGT5_ARUDO